MSDGFVSAYIDRAKTLLNVSKDEELAQHIGVGKSTIASWRMRGVIPDKAFEQFETSIGLNRDSFRREWFGSSQAETLLSKIIFYSAVARLFRAHEADPVDRFAIGLAANEGDIRKLIVTRLHEKHGDQLDEQATVIAMIKRNSDEYITSEEMMALAGTPEQG